MRTRLSSQKRVLRYCVFPLSGSEDLDTGFDGEKLVMSRAGGMLQYILKLHQTGGQYGVFASDLITLGADEAHSLRPASWINLNSASVILEIDRGMDGTIDETRILPNRALSVYLPAIMKNYTYGK